MITILNLDLRSYGYFLSLFFNWFKQIKILLANIDKAIKKNGSKSTSKQDTSVITDISYNSLKKNNISTNFLTVIKEFVVNYKAPKVPRNITWFYICLIRRIKTNINSFSAALKLLKSPVIVFCFNCSLEG